MGSCQPCPRGAGPSQTAVGLACLPPHGTRIQGRTGPFEQSPCCVSSKRPHVRTSPSFPDTKHIAVGSVRGGGRAATISSGGVSESSWDKPESLEDRRAGWGWAECAFSLEKLPEAPAPPQQEQWWSASRPEQCGNSEVRAKWHLLRPGHSGLLLKGAKRHRQERQAAQQNSQSVSASRPRRTYGVGVGR